MSNISNNSDSYKEKCIQLLGNKHFLTFLNSLDVEIDIHNCLLATHIMIVLAQSKGIRNANIYCTYNQSLNNPQINSDVPQAHVTYNIILTNHGQINKNNYSGGNLAISNPDGFPFYRPYTLHKWLKEQVNFFKNCPEHRNGFKLPTLQFNSSIKRTNILKKDRISKIYEQTIENQPIIKNYLCFYFLSQEIKITNNSFSNKIKL